MIDTPHVLRIAARFRGPPSSGSPPPLERELALEAGAPARLLDGSQLVAQAIAGSGACSG